jgi:hypothetical protein
MSNSPGSSFELQKSITTLEKLDAIIAKRHSILRYIKELVHKDPDEHIRKAVVPRWVEKHRRSVTLLLDVLREIRESKIPGEFNSGLIDRVNRFDQNRREFVVFYALHRSDVTPRFDGTTDSENLGAAWLAERKSLHSLLRFLAKACSACGLVSLAAELKVADRDIVESLVYERPINRNKKSGQVESVVSWDEFDRLPASNNMISLVSRQFAKAKVPGISRLAADEINQLTSNDITKDEKDLQTAVVKERLYSEGLQDQINRLSKKIKRGHASGDDVTDLVERREDMKSRRDRSKENVAQLDVKVADIHDRRSTIYKLKDVVKQIYKERFLNQTKRDIFTVYSQEIAYVDEGKVRQWVSDDLKEFLYPDKRRPANNDPLTQAVMYRDELHGRAIEDSLHEIDAAFPESADDATAEDRLIPEHRPSHEEHLKLRRRMLIACRLRVAIARQLLSEGELLADSSPHDWSKMTDPNGIWDGKRLPKLTFRRSEVLCLKQRKFPRATEEEATAEATPKEVISQMLGNKPKSGTAVSHNFRDAVTKVQEWLETIDGDV